MWEACGRGKFDVEFASCAFAKFELALGLLAFFAGALEAEPLWLVLGDSVGERRELMSMANGLFKDRQAIVL